MNTLQELGATGLANGWHIIEQADLPDQRLLWRELDELTQHWYESRSRRWRRRTWQQLCEHQPVLVGLDPHALHLNQNRQRDVAALVALVAAAATEPDAAIALVVATSGYWATCCANHKSIDLAAVFAAIRTLPADTPSLLTRPLTVILRQAVREGDQTAFRPLVRANALPKRTNRPGRVRAGQQLDWIPHVNIAVCDVEDRALTALAGADMLAAAGHLLNAKRRRELVTLVGEDASTALEAPAVDETRRRHCNQQTEQIARNHGLDRVA